MRPRAGWVLVAAVALAAASGVAGTQLERTYRVYGCYAQTPKMCFDRDEAQPVPGRARVAVLLPAAVAAAALVTLAVGGRRRRPRSSPGRP